MDPVALQLVRALRTTESRTELSRRLGYPSNVVARWERGVRWPTLGELLRAVAKLGIDLKSVMSRFHRAAAPAFDPAHPLDLDRWMRALAGRRTFAELARGSELSRDQIGRLLRGETRGRLPEALLLVEATTGRVAELVAMLVDVHRVPALREQVAAQERRVVWAAGNLWGPVVVAVIATFRPSPTRADAVRHLVERLRLDPDAAAAELAAAIVAGALREVGDRVEVDPRDAEVVPLLESELRRVRCHWASVAAHRSLDPGVNDLFDVQAVAVTRAELGRIQEIQRAAMREIRAIVAASERAEVAGLVSSVGLVWRAR